MNLINELNEEQIGLLKEADIKIENKDYTADECRYIRGQIISHIMSFSKKDIETIADRYERIFKVMKF